VAYLTPIREGRRLISLMAMQRQNYPRSIGRKEVDVQCTDGEFLRKLSS
jgi:hypothetical protein